MIDDFEQFEKEQEFLAKYVFTGLSKINNEFDGDSISYFDAVNFAIVLQRIQKLGLGIYGIEPWKDGQFYWVETFEDYTKDPCDPSWYLTVFEKFKRLDTNLQYAASYHIPSDLLK